MSEENPQRDETSDQREIIPGYASVEDFTKNGFKVLMEAIKHSSALPSGRDWDFYNTSDSFKKIINDEGSNVLRLMNQVMRCNEVDSNIRNRILDEKIELIIEANDVILEKVANNIDELNGIRKAVGAPVVLQTVSAQLPINGSWNRPSAATFTVNSTASESGAKNCIKLITAKNIVRPQKFFKDKVDNRNNIPWFPRITDKPNSLKPLAIFLEECGDRQEYSHPYEFELDRFMPIPEQLLAERPKLPKNLSDTPLVEIDKPEQLDELVETLRTCKEFAVDVEHHSYRSFMGFTCLVQISTEDKDYLIDTLALRDKLSILNEVFTKNTIVKIFHGADKDIEWLQRDLSIYVVNMFDTHQAAKILQYQGLSLAFLMKKFCNVLPNKQFQLADWRIRPLPEEFKSYAREDTHYLIYIYKMLKQELLAKANKSDNLLRSAIERSTEICKTRYFKPLLHEDSHLDLYRKCKKMFDNRQLYALKEIYFWRDFLARQEDESVFYVLPNHMMLQISETLPREMQGILACCNPIPPLVRSHLLELHQIVLKARDQPLERAIMKDTTGPGVLKKVSKVNVDSVLHCPHDLSRAQEFRDDLPTLLKNDKWKKNNRILANTDLAIEKSSSYSIFSDSFGSDVVFNERETFKRLRGFVYFSPFERYKLVKPFVVAEEEAAQAQNDEIKKQAEARVMVEETIEERGDEERIASIKDHFMQLSKKFSEELQAQKAQEEEEQRENERSLTEMGGSRKRKRDEENVEYSEQMEHASFNNFHSPVPSINYNGPQNHRPRYRGKKRRFDEMSEDQGEPARQGFFKRKKNNNQLQHLQQQQPGQKKKNKNNQQQLQQQQQPSPKQKKNKNNQQRPQQLGPTLPNQNNQQQQSPKKKNKIAQQHLQQSPKKKNRNQQQHLQQPGPHQQGNNQNQFHQSPKNKKQNQRGGFGHMQNEQVPGQQNNKPQQKRWKKNPNPNFTPYDYASVDFRQFQGGAGSANSGVKIMHNFKPKNQKNKGNRGARSSTFPNAKANRGGGQSRNS